VYPGGHFYFLGPAFAAVTGDVVRDIAPQLAAAAPLAIAG
jgi:hypothetical protein